MLESLKSADVVLATNTGEKRASPSVPSSIFWNGPHHRAEFTSEAARARSSVCKEGFNYKFNLFNGMVIFTLPLLKQICIFEEIDPFNPSC